jgi:hypothetical protein
MTKCLKQKGRSERVEAGAKSERAKRELEGKLLPFSWFFFYSFLVCFVLFMLEKNNCRNPTLREV